MKNNKKVLAWLLAVAMLVTNVDVVSAAGAVNTGTNLQEEVISREVSDGSVYSTGDGMDVMGGDKTVLFAAAEDGTVVASGEQDGLTWSITDTGVLTIGGTNTSDQVDGIKVSSWPWYSYRESVTKVVVTAENVKTTKYWFYDCKNLTEVDFTDFDTSSVVDMNCMFWKCSSLSSVDLSSLDTSSVTNMSGVFNGCSSLSSIDLSGLNTTRVRDMHGLFGGCTNLSSINLSGLDTSNVRTMSSMFGGCSKLTSLDLSGLDTTNVGYMDYMFNGCSGLNSLDLSSLNTTNVTSMQAMFDSCSGLSSLDLSGLDTSNVINMSRMFEGCSGLRSLDLSSLDTAKVEDMSIMFYGCTSLSDLNLSNLDTSNVKEMRSMFYGCSSLKSLDLSSFDTKNVTDMAFMFHGCKSLSNLDLKNFDTSNVTEMQYMFRLCKKLNSLNVSSFDTTNVTNMSNMFDGCEKLENLDLTSFVPKNVTSMYYMFDGCSSLTSLDLSNFDTSKVTEMTGMFVNCSSLESLDLSGFNTENVDDTRHMFNGCSSLTSLDLSNFKTPSLTNMSEMFSGCSSLLSLDLSSFDTKNVTDMYGMLYGCSNLLVLDISGFDVSSLSLCAYFMAQCTSLMRLHCMPNLELDIVLPKAMVDIESNTVYSDYLPKNLDSSLWLYEELQGSGTWNGLSWYVTGTGVLVITGTYAESASGVETDIPWQTYAGSVNKVVVDAKNIPSVSGWFQNFNALEEANLACLDTSVLLDGTNLFEGCVALEQINVPKGLKAEIVLPYVMYDKDFESYTTLPKERMTNTILFKGESGEVDGMQWLFVPEKATLLLTGKNTATTLPTRTEYPWKAYCSDIEKVIIKTENVISTAHWFEECSNLKTVDISAFDSSKVKDMSYMFKGCSALSTLDVSSLNVGSVTNMTGMFEGCSELKKIKVFKGLTADGVLPTAMYDEQGNRYINFPKGVEESFWVQVEDCAGENSGITWMINDAGTLFICGTDTTTEAVTEPSWGWLSYTDTIKKAVVSAKEVKSTSGWFTGCSKLTEVDFTEFDTGTVTDMSYMFKDCSGLSVLDLSGISVSAATDMTGLLEGCTALQQVKVPEGLTLDVPLPTLMFDVQYNLYKSFPKGVEESFWLHVESYAGEENGISWVLNDEGVLYIRGTDVSTETVTEPSWGWLVYTDTIKKVVVSAKEVKSTSGWFAGCNRLTEADLSAFDMEKVTLCDKMFDGCSALQKVNTPLNVKGDVELPNVLVDMDGVTYSKLPKNQTNSILLEKATASGIYCGLNWMLIGGDKLLIFGTYAEKAAGDTFWDTYAADVKTVKISATGVKSTANWFKGMSVLESLDLSQVDLSQVTDMSGMFKDCAKLIRIDLEQFVFADGVDVTDFLDGCVGLAEIRVPANLQVAIEIPKPMYNYLGEVQSDFFPMNQPEAEWYYAVSPVGEGEFHVSKVYPQTYTGTAIKPQIRVYDGATLLVEKKDYTISYKNNKNVYVTKSTENGANDGLDDKKAPTIVVKGKGNYTKTETITFDIVAKDLNDEDIVVNELVAVAGNKIQKPVPVLKYNGKKLVNNKDFTVEYPDLENASKTDAYKAAGTYTVRVTGKGNFTGTRDITFTIASGALMSKVKVSKIPVQNYNGGKDVEPEFTVTYKKTTLEVGEDYTFEFVNNTEVGTASIILRGMGEYAGTKTVTFRILGTSIAKATVTGLVDKEYNGQAQTQNLKVELGGKTLSGTTDYEVAYSKNIDAGTATVIITGKGAYSGSLKKTFKIKAYDLETNSKKLFKGVPANLKAPYTKGGCTPTLDLIFSGEGMVVKQDYTITYKNNKNVASAKETNAKGKSIAPTVIIKGKGNFTGTVEVPFSIVAKKLQNEESPVKINVPDLAYSAKAGKYMSKPVLTDANGKKLVAGVDYEKEITYTLVGTAANDAKAGMSMTDAGAESTLDKTAVPEAGSVIQVTVTGKGNYSGTMEATYCITQASFNSAKVKIEPRVYTGNNVTLDKEDITVTMKGETLTYGVDYVIVEDSYKNNVKKGNATVTVKGIGNYGGEKTAKFKIVSKELIWFWRLIL